MNSWNCEEREACLSGMAIFNKAWKSLKGIWSIVWGRYALLCESGRKL
jgi:hypothetical protein